MKILTLTRNEANQIIAEVLTCGKTLKIFAWNIEGLVETIYKSVKFTTKEDILVDLSQNYSEFK
jgi:hypothetical protein